MSEVIDLRNDAVTEPTEAMWNVMRSAPLGWAAAGEDRNVNRLEELAGELTGKERALFVPTGAMANLLTLLVHRGRGHQIIAEESSHVVWSEEWGYAALCGLSARALAGDRGALRPEELRAALLDRRFGHHPRTAVVCLENTHNAAGGAVITPEQTVAVAGVAHEFDVPVHLDGARVFNAAVALGVPACHLTHPVDSVMVTLSKGLSAPAGSVLCGSSGFIEEAREALRLVGGASIPQAGILAAAGIVALETMVERLADDHRRARALAEGLAALDGVEVDLASVQTNIVMAHIDPNRASAGELQSALETRGVRAYVYSADTLRFVTHRHITDGDIDRAITAVSEVLQSSPFAHHARRGRPDREAVSGPTGSSPTGSVPPGC
jgi:threonine aldolase